MHHDGFLYVALFNYANSQAVKSVSLARLGALSNAVQFDELWTGTKVAANGNLSANLAPYDVRLFKSTQPAVRVAPRRLLEHASLTAPRREHDALGRVYAPALRILPDGSLRKAEWLATFPSPTE